MRSGRKARGCGDRIPVGTCFGAVEIVPYRPDTDCESVYSLWRRNFGARWPIALGVFREVTEAEHSHVETHQLTARDGKGRPIGYIGGQIRPRREAEASIVLLMVAPDRQRRGVGGKLLQAFLGKCERERITTVHLGANADLPFWQGIPTCLPAARGFFEKHGWQVYETSYDLIMDLRDLAPPEWVEQRPREHGVCIRVAGAGDVPALFRYLEAEFPDWRRWFVREVEAGGTANVIVACRGPQVVGSMIMSDASGPVSVGAGRQWRTFLGEDMGAVGAVCVQESERNKGIGLAMVAVASRTLRDRGVRNCFVHWTWLVEWYGRLGYRVWQEYWMAKRMIGASPETS